MPASRNDVLPEGICLSTLKLTKAGTYYSSAAVRDLWAGHRVSPVLDFKKEDFLTVQRESAGRISISGVQEKISLKLRGNKLIPTETRGDYILKPVPLTSFPHFTPDIPANEHFTMQLARQVFGINTAANGIVYFADGEPAYITRRFDRQADGTPLAQEDFCQLSNRSPDNAGQNYKYDSSYEETGTILRRYVPSYRIEIEKLFSLILFNYLIANGDAHLKNFSLLETPLGDHALSPTYDLLNTTLHVPTESQTALDLFADDFETPAYKANAFLTRPDFQELATRFEISKPQANKILDRATKHLPAIQSLLSRSLLSPSAKEAYLTIAADRFKAITQNH